MRSSWKVGQGASPTSCRKAAKDFLHRRQILIPRPPYALYRSLFGLQHRCFMFNHALYSFVVGVLWPWMTLVLIPSVVIRAPKHLVDLLAAAVALREPESDRMGVRGEDGLPTGRVRHGWPPR